MSVVNDTFVLVRSHHFSSAADQTNHKFFLLYEGPFVVKARVSDNAYILEDPDLGRIIGTYNIIHLQKYHPPAL